MGALPSIAPNEDDRHHGDTLVDSLDSLDLTLAPSGQALLVPHRRLSVLGARVDILSADEVLNMLAVPTLQQRHLCYVNAHSLNLAFRDDAYREALGRADLVLNDGFGLHIAARMQGRRFPENLNGSDFTLRILRLAATERWRVFLYGGRPGVAATARDRLCDAIPQLDIVGVRDGFGDDDESAVAEQIRAAGPDVLIVALGQPKQELWLDRHLQATGASLGVGVGAFLDFQAGEVVRAPAWMNRLGIEWAFRLVQEPRRLWRRYVVGNPMFLWRAWRLRSARPA